MRRRRKHKFLKIKFLAAGLIIIISIFAIISIKFFTIRNVLVAGNISCIDDIKKIKTSNILGQNLLVVNEKKLEEDILKRYFCVKRISLKRKFPDRVDIELFERVPKLNVIAVDMEASSSADIMENLAVDASPSSKIKLDSLAKKGSFVADDEGVIFANVSREDLPKIYMWTDLKLGQRLKDNLAGKILDIIRQLNVFGINTGKSILNSNGTYLMYSDPFVYFNLKGNLDLQIASLQLILKEAKIYSNVEYVDLRFDKPVIKLAPKK